MAAAKPAEVKTVEPVKPEVKQESFDEWLRNNPKPDKEKDLAGYLVWNAEKTERKEAHDDVQNATTREQQKIESLIGGAQAEIEEIQNEYKKTNPDYENAINHAKAEYSKAIKTLMPQLSEKQVKQAIDKEILNMALKCNREGTNLGEVLYDTAIERFGYDPDNAGAKPSQESVQRPNLRVVANNKRKSASSLGGGGEGAKGRITLEQLADMTPNEQLNLDASDWEYARKQGWL